MRRNSFPVVLAIAAVTLLALAASANAALLVYEPFAYPDGWLTGQGGAFGTTGTWTAYDTHNHDWRIHQEGDTAGIVVDPGPPVVRGMFDGTVANLPTSGGYVGLPGPLDLTPPADPDTDFEIGRNMDASIALDPTVTATFQSGTTTWFSYVAARAWDRNMETPNLTIGTDPSPNESRAASLTNNGNGIGTGGGPPRNNRTHIYPMFFEGGNVNNLNGPWNGVWNNSAYDVPADGRMNWVASDADGFGAANVVVGKIQWDADTGGADVISVARFLETDTLSEAAFDALIAAQPNLSSANWAAANKPNLDQSQFDTLNIAGLKFFVDEIRIGTTFDDVIGAGGGPGGGPVAIAGTDFSNTPEFNAPGGQANLDNVNIDDLNPSDNITVTNWAFAGGGAFEGWDGNAQVGMPNSPVTKLNGSGGHAQPNVGDDPPTFNEASFSIDIPDDTILDLTTVTWDWRAATTSGNQRWLAFRTSLDDTLIFSEVGLARNNVDNQIITFDDPKYKNLTDETVTFYWYASGEGTGDIDIDTIIVNGEVRGAAAVPEPSTFALAALGLLGLAFFARRRRRLP